MTTAELSPFTRRRRLSIDELIAELQEQQARKNDLVVPAHRMRATPEGYLEVAGAGEPILSATGVTPVDGLFTMSRTFDSGVAGKLRIPAAYLTRMREEDQLPLLAENVNAWLVREPNRKFLVRTFRDRNGEPGIARGLLSDSYAIRDNFPVLLAVLQGIEDRGAEVQITGELSDRLMQVQITAPRITADAAPLLRNYRSPFSGQSGAGCPVVSAGVRLTNSELGFGKSSITPVMTVQVCDNGLVITQDAMSTIHTGRKHDHGVIRYSSDTIRKELETVTLQARDAVKTFLDTEYMVRKLNEIAAEASVDVADPNATIEHVGSVVGYTQEQQARILAHFIKGADVTAGGVLHAVTSAAQTLPDADSAWEMEKSGLKALTAAARFQR